jgi:hypothetical protein
MNVETFKTLRQELIGERLDTIEKFSLYIGSHPQYRSVIEFLKTVRVSPDASLEACYAEYLHWIADLSKSVNLTTFGELRTRYFKFYPESKLAEVVVSDGNDESVQFVDTPAPIVNEEPTPDVEAQAIDFIISNYIDTEKNTIGQYYDKYSASVKNPIDYENFNRFMVTQGFKFKNTNGVMSWILDN